MPTCPNCGSYIPLGNHSCSCGTTLRYDYEPIEEKEEEIDLLEDLQFLARKKVVPKKRSQDPYNYDFLNKLDEKGHNPIFLNQMNNEIAEIEEKYNAKLYEFSVYKHMVFFNFLVERNCYDAILSAYYDTTYGYNYFEISKDIITPKFEKLYSNDKFKRLILKTQEEINEKFQYCRIFLFGDEFVLKVYFENQQFFLDDDTVEFVD